MQAKDIPDSMVLDAVRAMQDEVGASLWDVQKALSAFPPKVVKAKLSGLVRRKILDGCDCGCRGDFVIVGEH